MMLILFFTDPVSAEFKSYWKATLPIGASGDGAMVDRPAFSLGLQNELRPSPGWTGVRELPFADRRSAVVFNLDKDKGLRDAGGGEKADFRYSVGVPFLSVPLFEWGKRNSSNEFIGFRGINYGLGFQSKNYFKPPMKHAWNSFWQWGTVYLLIPYIGIGTEYMTNNVYFEIGTLYIIPYIGLGFHF